MRFHASCGAWPGQDGADAVLLLGKSGSGKSDFLARLIDAGWMLVADDQVFVEDGFASAPKTLAGLIELRGLGIFRLPYLPRARLRLAVRLGAAPARLPEPALHATLGLPEVTIDPARNSAVARAKLCLDVACGRVGQLAGAFAA
jgi:HPr kinase/phosphorylase